MPAVPLPLDVPEIAIAAAGGAVVRRSVLPSGVRVLTEHMPGAVSATVGYWVPVGSRDESGDARGSTHFLEHLLFKGTPTRTAFDIAVAFDEVGGEHNAVTAKEHTCYYAKVRDVDLPMAIDVLADMLTSSLLDPDEFEHEREVILEELAMADDDPADVAGERLSELVHGDETPLGRPIGGTPESIRAVSRDRVAEHYAEHYGPSDLVVTIAGAVDHDIAVEQLQVALERYGWSLGAGSPQERRSTSPRPAGPGGLTVVARPLEQVNLMIGMPGLIASDPRRSTMAVLNAVLGAGMSSRLFQEIREKRGLAYSVYSWASGYADAGVVGLAAACAPRKTLEVASLMLGELERLAEGVTEEELRRAKGQLAGGSALALEDTDTRMSRLGRAELTLGEFLDIDATLERIGAVTDAEVRSLATELAAGPRSIAAVGKVPDGLGALVASAAPATVEAAAPTAG
ncbi:pitrilysin family protein [Agrococcus sp. HG114]|uniref:M16 family metallopeptidase n=1 Tax=Agrococcus sp. HG114 TaxID=2969757 RepID=UPI00215A6306|nr:pitrilysin family protein [Agrococcus sp. HG114]MCR8671346.1 insulinase family protein [Agrococcus sp. HG114]